MPPKPNRITGVGARVSALVGAQIQHVEGEDDDGGGAAGGSAGGKKRKPPRRREEVFGTVAESLETKGWYRVRWDAPIYKGNHNGALESLESYNALSVVPDGTGTGPGSPTSRR